MKKKQSFKLKYQKLGKNLDESQNENRVLFAHPVLRSTPDLTKIVFSDESRFVLRLDNKLIRFTKV